MAHAALRSAGLDDTYYRLVGMSPAAKRQPVAERGNALTAAYLGTPDFVARHGTANSDGTHTVALQISGMHCVACSWLVDQVVTREAGVCEAEVDLPRARVQIKLATGQTSLAHVADRLATFGYHLHPVDASHSDAGRERSLLIRVGVCWAIAGNVMLLAFTFYSGLDATLQPELAGAARWASLALTSAAIFVGGSVFFRRAMASIVMAARARNPFRLHMDVPISLGILVGFVASAYSTASGTESEIWFDSIAILIAALLTARWLQTRGQQSAREASERLFSVLPRVARKLATDGTEQFVSVDDLEAGDLLRVETGESCPTDGQVVSGQTHFNQAALTGESHPVQVAPGDAALAGTINLGATVVVRASAPGASSQVGQMLGWLENNRGRKADVVLMADRLAGWFVFAVVLLAGLTAVVGVRMFPGDVVNRVVAMLVIACPCALGMATPLVMVTARGRSARRGCLIKNDATVETLSLVDSVVLDKTGTITSGDLHLVDVHGDATVLDAVAILEMHSRHPVAAAIGKLGRARERDRDRATDVEERWGRGIEGVVDGRRLLVGNPRWVDECTSDLTRDRTSSSAELTAASAAVADAGQTPVAVAVDGVWRSVLAFQDPLREDARQTVESMQSRGQQVYLLSGDHPDATARVGQQLGLPPENVLGGALPRDKERFVTELRQSGRVAMIGDGINDATAMRTADVGIALGSHNAPAVVAADILIQSGNLSAANDLIDLAHNARRRIRANLTFSVAYNITGALAAMAGLVTPLVAAVAMPASSLIVIATSLMLDYSRSQP